MPKLLEAWAMPGQLAKVEGTSSGLSLWPSIVWQDALEISYTCSFPISNPHHCQLKLCRRFDRAAMQERAYCWWEGAGTAI